MTASILKNKLHYYIESAEHKKLKAIYKMLENEIEMENSILTTAQKKELDIRWDEYKKGKSKNYSWDEMLSKIKPTA